jgi:hypothetical protein
MPYHQKLPKNRNPARRNRSQSLQGKQSGRAVPNLGAWKPLEKSEVLVGYKYRWVSYYQLLGKGTMSSLPVR